jgi:hypothetical protein
MTFVEGASQLACALANVHAIAASTSDWSLLGPLTSVQAVSILTIRCVPAQTEHIGLLIASRCTTPVMVDRTRCQCCGIRHTCSRPHYSVCHLAHPPR